MINGDTGNQAVRPGVLEVGKGFRTGEFQTRTPDTLVTVFQLKGVAFKRQRQPGGKGYRQVARHIADKLL